MTAKNLSTIIGVIFLETLLFACSGNVQHQTLAVFFDGVPQPAGDDITQADSVTNPEIGAPTVKDTTAIVTIGRSASIHSDYLQKSCEKCHDIAHANRLVQRQPELCYQCHKRFDSKYVKVHGPVAAGFCTACHVAHKSEYKALLIMPVRQVCQHCHEPGDVEKNQAHDKISKVECLECHDAHGGKTKNLLKN
jgi:predicted CXXCH cytochrome family protein